MLAKRQARKVAGKVATIRYRAVPDLSATGCKFDQPDIELTKEEGMDLLDPVTCVTAKVEGEDGMIRMTKDGELFDLECNDDTNQDDMEIGSEFTCQGRVWDIGSIGTEMDTPTSCPSNTTGLSAVEYINAQCCTCL